MTAPIGREVGEAFEAVGNTVVDLLFVGIGLVIGLADTFGDDFWVAFAMASVLAIRALHASSIFEEFSTQRTAHDIVELLRNELVSLFLVNLFLFLADGTLAVETNIEGATVLELLGWREY